MQAWRFSDDAKSSRIKPHPEMAEMVEAADSDDAGRAFRNDVGHRFRSKSVGRSD